MYVLWLAFTSIAIILQAHIYQRFLNRIVTNDLTKHVLPLRTQSITGARMLHFLNYTVDAIYLDGAQVRSFCNPGL
jgi:hypothetical protein